MRRSAYTLVEILLVLALLVLAAALVAPAVLQGGDRNELEDAAEKLANMWARARLDAVTSGQTLVFRCVPGAGEATVGGMDGLTAEAMGDELAAQAAAAAPTQQLTLASVTLQRLAVSEPPGSAPVLYEDAASGGQCLVIFRPDGGASDAEAILRHEGGEQLRVTLRGLTGATRVLEATPETGGD